MIKSCVNTSHLLFIYSYVHVFKNTVKATYNQVCILLQALPQSGILGKQCIFRNKLILWFV